MASSTPIHEAPRAGQRPDAEAGPPATLLAAGLERARRLGRPVLVSAVRRVEAVPDALSTRGVETAEPSPLSWSQPAQGFALRGCGAAWSVAGAGDDRFGSVATAWRDLCADAVVERPAEVPAGTGPVLLAGFAFDPLLPKSGLWAGWPDGFGVLPRRLLTRAAGGSWLTLSAVVRPDGTIVAPETGKNAAAPRIAQCGGTPDEAGDLDAWCARVRALQHEIHAGAVRKVVLARSRRVLAPAPFAAGPALRRLNAAYPECSIFSFEHAGACFLGATPELLVRLTGGVVETAALAASVARGATEEDDRRLADALLASPKEREEHALVVRGIREALAAAGVQTAAPAPPTVWKLANVQHLRTPITGTAAAGQTVLDLVAGLHPTPAMGGYPTAAALQAIRAHEGLERGWYTGPVGWMDARGEGAFAVAIRSALLRGREASVFAGCGIVAGSEPEREYAESCLKLRPMLNALGATLP